VRESSLTLHIPQRQTPFRERLEKDIDTARQIDLEAQECGAMIVRAG
jgi:hypothetical protein